MQFIIKAALGQKSLKAMRRFARDDDGSTIVFGLFAFMAMIIVGGMAVDFMRYETRRTQLQNTLDRAVLAAADLEQRMSPAEVVSDYFDKAGLASALAGTPHVVDSFGYREVSASARDNVKSIFLNMVGIDSLVAPASGSATEGATDVEISLVLDLSGSMGSNHKIDNLRTAASQFVDTIYSRNGAGTASISLVPYAMHVNAGANLLSRYNFTRNHSNSNCAAFAASDFTQTSLIPTRALAQVAHFDPTGNNGQMTGGSISPVCRTDAASQIQPLSGSATALKNQIAQFTAGGNTSLEIGMKWGAALLDPATQPVISGLIANGTVSASFNGRPSAFNDGRTLKVIVLMTDGVNTTQYDLLPPYKSGPSGVWADASSGRLSVAVTENGRRDSDTISNEPYFIPHLYSKGDFFNAAPFGTARQLTYPELWAGNAVRYNATNNRYNANGSSADRNFWQNDILDVVAPGEKDRRLSEICSAAKSQGIIVYTIGFEVTTSSSAVLASCASSPSHFFLVNGLEIETAFQSIARQINQLRLTK